MPLGNFGKQLGENRAEKLGEFVHQSAVLANLQDAHPQGKRSGEAEGHLEAHFRHFKRRVHHLWQSLGIAHEDKAHHTHQGTDDKQADPYIVESHFFVLILLVLQMYKKYLYWQTNGAKK